MSDRSDNMSADWWHREADRYCSLHIAAHQRIVELAAELDRFRGPLMNEAYANLAEAEAENEILGRNVNELAGSLEERYGELADARAAARAFRGLLNEATANYDPTSTELWSLDAWFEDVNAAIGQFPEGENA